VKNLLYSLCFILFFSCLKKEQDSLDNETQKPLLSVVKKHEDLIKIESSFTQEIENWNELKALDNFILRFKKASPNEVLSNALELKSLVSSLKDSVKPSLFEIPSFNTRVNILYNETLRLADMTFIPAIKADQVNMQTDKIINTFSAVNSKINTILTKKRFEDAIKVNVDFIGLDSTKIDSVSKKSIKKELYERALDKSKKKQ
jgi:hypothetical protein